MAGNTRLFVLFPISGLALPGAIASNAAFGTAFEGQGGTGWFGTFGALRRRDRRGSLAWRSGFHPQQRRKPTLAVSSVGGLRVEGESDEALRG